MIARESTNVTYLQRSAHGALLETRAEKGQRRLRACWLLEALQTIVDGAVNCDRKIFVRKAPLLLALEVDTAN